MFGPMFPHGRDENAQLKEPKPEHLKDWPSYILRNAKKLFRRLFYIYGLVWDARPWIFITMIFMTVFNGVSPVISAYISKVLERKLKKGLDELINERYNKFRIVGEFEEPSLSDK